MTETGRNKKNASKVYMHIDIEIPKKRFGVTIPPQTRLSYLDSLSLPIVWNAFVQINTKGLL